MNIQATLEKITGIMLEMAHRQDAHDGQLIETNKRLDRIALHIDALDVRMEAAFVAITQTNATVNRMAEKVDQVATKVDALVDVVAKHEERLNK
jgi:methyl-accepting chemotaxis protein